MSPLFAVNSTNPNQLTLPIKYKDSQSFWAGRFSAATTQSIDAFENLFLPHISLSTGQYYVDLNVEEIKDQWQGWQRIVQKSRERSKRSRRLLENCIPEADNWRGRVIALSFAFFNSSSIALVLLFCSLDVTLTWALFSFSLLLALAIVVAFWLGNLFDLGW